MRLVMWRQHHITEVKDAEVKAIQLSPDIVVECRDLLGNTILTANVYDYGLLHLRFFQFSFIYI